MFAYYSSHYHSLEFYLLYLSLSAWGNVTLLRCFNSTNNEKFSQAMKCENDQSHQVRCLGRGLNDNHKLHSSEKVSLSSRSIEKSLSLQYKDLFPHIEGIPTRNPIFYSQDQSKKCFPNQLLVLGKVSSLAWTLIPKFAIPNGTQTLNFTLYVIEIEAYQ